MTIFVVDIESDGPAPGLYSMVSLGCVRVDRALTTTFKATFAPISARWVPEALAISEIAREEHLAYPDPAIGMNAFRAFLSENSKGRPIFVSDNPAFDWSFANYYFHAYGADNPFGFSARRIGDFYAGLKHDFGAASQWKSLRKTIHTHDPVDDAIGNAEALIAFADEYGVKLPGV